jgi:NhaA family Na+:H+ antiporter
VAISADTVSTLSSSVSLGIILGLVVGKPLGISLISYAAVRIGLAELPEGIQWRQLTSASFLAGIGFTMALFIGGAAFSGEPLLLKVSKLAILVASVFAALIGSILLFVTSPSSRTVSLIEPTAASAD